MAIKTRRNKGQVSYQVRVRDKCGRWMPSKSFGRREDAKRYERELLTLRDKGTLAASLTAAQSITYAEYWMQYREERRTDVSEGWKKHQDQIARDHILPYVGHMKLADIRSPDIGRIMVLLDKEKNLGTQTRLHVYNVLHKTFDETVEYYEYLAISPVKRRDKPKLMRTERKFLPPWAIGRLLVTARPHRLGPAVWLGALAGMRISEIQALRFESVDYDRKRIVIKEAYKRHANKIEPYPKQRNWGHAPLPKDLADYLKELSKGQHPKAFVCKSASGGMLPYRAFYFGLRELCDEAGVPQITPHELRHSCTEVYTDEGANIEDLRRILNHTSMEAVRAYVHRMDGRVNNLASKVSVAKLAMLPVPEGTYTIRTQTDVHELRAQSGAS